jgi:hypothetical protein
VTAGAVIAIGLALFPVGKKQEPPPAPPVVAPTPPAPPPTPASDAAAVASTPAGEAGTAATKAADAGSAAAAIDAARTTPEKVAAAEPEAAKTPEDLEPLVPAPGKVIDKQKQADKDLAREAWRRNRPDISVQGAKTAIMIPIKGSTKGADSKITDKRRLVTVTLPRAVSMVTMRVYNLKHPAFKKLWIDQDEANAQPANGTKLRLILSQTLDPKVEITEDFVRVTIRRPESDDSSDEKAEKRAEKRREKRAEKPEKASEPPEEPAPEKEKE